MGDSVVCGGKCGETHPNGVQPEDVKVCNDLFGWGSLCDYPSVGRERFRFPESDTHSQIAR